MKIKILNNGVVTNDSIFSSQEEADNWLNYHRSINSFGQEAGQRLISPEESIKHPEIPTIPAVPAHGVIAAEFDELGAEISPMIPAFAGTPEVVGSDAWIEIISPAVYEPVEGFTVVYEDITEQLAKEAQIKELKEKGAAARLACSHVLDLVGGYNYSRNLTSEQINEMSVLFAPIVQCLLISRPSSAKALISAITPDEVLITAQIKEDILNELNAY